MTHLTLLCGAPGSSLLLLARELDTGPRARVLFPWNLGAALEELARATRERAQAWQGPLAAEVPWIERSLELAAPALVEALLERERGLRGPIEWLGIGHFALARHAARLARVLPAARFVLCGDDGCIAPSGRIPAQADARAQAWAGFEWGQQWSASVGPLLALGPVLGERLIVLGEDELARDPESVKTQLLGSTEPLNWGTTRPWKRERLPGPALAGFACSRAARGLQQALGREPLEPDAEVLVFPELAAEFALGALEEGDLERAQAVLPRRAEPGPAGARVELVRGRLALARGDRERAVAAWLAALELDPEQGEAFERLFELGDERCLPELAGRARHSGVARVRHALARWLVARGLDAQAAELLARVEHQGWSVRAD